MNSTTRQYLIVTGSYWAFTLTDGALRMLVVLHFHQLGYSPLDIALLFLFYEIFGVITNLVGGWLGAHFGLNRTMHAGLILQVLALAMLLVGDELLTIAWVMSAQALSGIAKDLNKMSAKSAVKLLVPESAQGRLFRWVAVLTGSKNFLKGAGFFLGGAMLGLLGFHNAIAGMAAGLGIVWLLSLLLLNQDLGKATNKPRFVDLFSKSISINLLSAARLFLFAARDVWFVVALPVYLATQLHFEHTVIGGFLALWIMGYGITQSLTPVIFRRVIPNGRSATVWIGLLSAIPAGIALALSFGTNPGPSLLLGLLVFGTVFAINSAIHSFLIVHYADREAVSLDVGFYYMANAMGRLLGTLLSGWVYQSQGMAACLWISSLLLVMGILPSLLLPQDLVPTKLIPDP